MAPSARTLCAMPSDSAGARRSAAVRCARRAGQRDQHGRRRSRPSTAGFAIATPHYVCVTGVHGVMESQRDEELRAHPQRRGAGHAGRHAAGLAGRISAAIAHVERVYGPDLMLALLRDRSSTGLRATSSTAARRASPSSWPRGSRRGSRDSQSPGMYSSAVPAAHAGRGRRGRRRRSTPPAPTSSGSA